MVRKEIEDLTSAPCYNPSEDNVNWAPTEKDVDDRDGRWLLLWLEGAQAAACSGGHVVQLRIPGLGLSQMQEAEEMIANLCGLRLDRRDLNQAVLDELKHGGLDLGPDGGASLLQSASCSLDRKVDELLKVVGAGGGGKEFSDNLMTMSLSLEVKLSLTRPESLWSLVQVLQNGDSREAAWALENLMAMTIPRGEPAPALVPIVEARALPAFVRLLAEGTPVAKTQAACALGNIAASLNTRKARRPS